ncbi:MAG: MerR family transcriptional regulator [Bacteroidota bacterium]|jgi:DNA-binding transcriptional MerR regulator
MQIAFDFTTPSNDKPQKKAEQKVPSKRGRKSLKALTEEANSIELPSDEELSKKLYHSISEVSQMFGMNPSSLRYWETEFKQINPRKNKKGDRFYTLADIKLLQLIHFLLRQRKYTIEGAKEYLKKHKDEAAARYAMIEKMQQLKSFLLALKADI